MDIASHIQMPKSVLKRFHNGKNQFCYYDVEGGYIGTRGSADSTNTKRGYYSQSGEDFLRDYIETPFGNILTCIDKVDFDQERFSISSNFNEVTRNFIYALMARDPFMHSEMNENSVFSQFLPEQMRHDFAAERGIAIAQQNNFFAEYILTFMVNRTGTPFVLPLSGVYSYKIENHSVINLPIAPQTAICLVHKDYASRLIHDDGTISMFLVEFPDMIMKMNTGAFSSQINRNWGRVICPTRNELDRLKTEYQAKKGTSGQ